MPKVLFVTTVSGTLRAFLLPFAEHFRSQGWVVDGMAQGITDCSICRNSFDRVWEVNWSRNPLEFNNFIETPKRVKEVVLEEQYDIVHVHTPVAAFITRLALRKARKNGRPKIVYTAHGFHFYKGAPAYKNAVFLFLEKIAGRWTDYLIVINKEDKSAAVKHKILSADHLVYMPGIGVDASFYAPEKVSDEDIEKLRKALKLKPDDKVFLMVGEFISRKRHRDLLEAFSYIRDPHIHLVFAGVGPLMEEMKNLANKKGIGSNVHFLGYRNDIPILMRTSLATILPSEQEGLPRCAMESLSLGVPVIATDIRGTRELVETGGGKLFKVGDIEGLRDAMQYIIDNPEAAQEMGRVGRKQVLEKYELSKIIEMHEALYYRALESAR
jgi:glycosyltransferase involved in cell wall biosynthesis